MTVDDKSSYYDAGGIECIQIIKAKLTDEQYQGFCLGNALKYLCRANFKHETLERDIEKAGIYLSMLKDMKNEDKYHFSFNETNPHFREIVENATRKEVD